jgi:hypothetical protein
MDLDTSMIVPPWEPSTHGNAGWLVKTRIAESNIKDAGRGRFAAQRISKGEYIRHVRINRIDESEPINLKLLRCPDQILQIMTASAYHMVADAYQRDEQKLADFVFADPSHEGALLYTSGCMFNHGVDLKVNVKGGLRDVAWGTVIAARDIAKGEELLCDYNNYCIPLGIRTAIIQRGAWDVPTLLNSKGDSMFH